MIKFTVAMILVIALRICLLLQSFEIDQPSSSVFSFSGMGGKKSRFGWRPTFDSHPVRLATNIRFTPHSVGDQHSILSSLCLSCPLSHSLFSLLSLSLLSCSSLSFNTTLSFNQTQQHIQHIFEVLNLRSTLSSDQHNSLIHSNTTTHSTHIRGSEFAKHTLI